MPDDEAAPMMLLPSLGATPLLQEATSSYKDTHHHLLFLSFSVYFFECNSGIEVGMSNNAALIADGTPAKPITFTTVPAANGQAGSWYGITFGSDNVIATTVLNNCIIEGAGKKR